MVTIQRGGLYLNRALYERHFAGLETVILLRRGEDLLVLPVHDAGAGGYLLKLRNGAGDRVVNAPDFFRRHGHEDDVTLCRPAAWSSTEGGLCVSAVFSTRFSPQVPLLI
jgi:hypothetical protein